MGWCKRWKALLSKGAQGVIGHFKNASTGAKKDSLLYTELVRTDDLLIWTRAVRGYEDVPLREFVQEMSRWYGFRVKDYRCLPLDKRITATVCYRKDQKAAFAAIRDAGVLLYENKGMISFCPDDVKVKSAGAVLAYK